MNGKCEWCGRNDDEVFDAKSIPSEHDLNKPLVFSRVAKTCRTCLNGSRNMFTKPYISTEGFGREFWESTQSIGVLCAVDLHTMQQAVEPFEIIFPRGYEKAIRAARAVMTSKLEDRAHLPELAAATIREMIENGDLDV